MKQEELTKEILKILGNNHTAINVSKEYSANYYSWITDTIYLKHKQNEGKKIKWLENTNHFCGALVTICHECVHSVQNKGLHIINFVLSNISIMLALIAIVLMAVWNKPSCFVFISGVIIILAMLVRLRLEIEAIFKSLVLAEKARHAMNIQEVNSQDMDNARRIVKRLLLPQSIQMILGKIVMLIIVVI